MEVVFMEGFVAIISKNRNMDILKHDEAFLITDVEDEDEAQMKVEEYLEERNEDNMYTWLIDLSKLKELS
jgi:hypothetical protein